MNDSFLFSRISLIFSVFFSSWISQVKLHGQLPPCSTRDCQLEICEDGEFELDSSNMQLWFNKNQNVSYVATRLNLWTGGLIEHKKITFVRINDSLKVSTLSQEFLPLEVFKADGEHLRLFYEWSWSDARYIYYLNWLAINDCCSVVQLNRRPIKRWGKKFAHWKWLGDYVIVRPEND